MSDKTIKVEALARVEGEGKLDIKIRDGKITELIFNIYEPPRFFEAFLVGRKYYDVPDMTARICGICPVSYQMASTAAIEDAFDITPSQQTVYLRKLLALSQWIQSHALHVYMLALPDYLGYESVLALPEEYLPVVKRALRLKRLGNDLTALIGGREVHPVTTQVKGFTSVPTRAQLAEIRKRLDNAKEDALETVKLVNSLSMPEFIRDCEHIALIDQFGEDYAINSHGNRGNLGSTRGLNIPLREFRSYITEHHVPPSNALRSFVNDKDTYMVGPLPRVNINFDLLSDDAKKAAEETGVKFPNFDVYKSALARAIEIVHSIDDCIKTIDLLGEPKKEDLTVTTKAGEGWGASEAPRGLLYHNYIFDEDGIVQKAEIVSPTAQNSANIEENLWKLVPQYMDLSEEEISFRSETFIRCYDPCISCSAHFLKLNIERS